MPSQTNTYSSTKRGVNQSAEQWAPPVKQPSSISASAAEADARYDAVWSTPAQPTVRSTPARFTGTSTVENGRQPHRHWLWASRLFGVVFWIFFVLPATLRVQALPVKVVPANRIDLPYTPSGAGQSWTWWLSLAVVLAAVKLVAGRWKGQGSRQADLGLLTFGYTGLVLTLLGVLLAADERKHPFSMDPVPCITQDCWPEPQQSWARAIPIIVTFIIMIIVGHLGENMLLIQRVIVIQAVMIVLSLVMMLTWNSMWYPSFARNLPESTWGMEASDYDCDTRPRWIDTDITITLPDGTETSPVIALPDTRFTATGTGTEVTMKESHDLQAVTAYPRVLTHDYTALDDDAWETYWVYTPLEGQAVDSDTLTGEEAEQVQRAINAADFYSTSITATASLSTHQTTITLAPVHEAAQAAKQAGLTAHTPTLTITSPDVTVIDSRIGPVGDGTNLAYGVLLSNGCERDSLMFLMISEHSAVGTTVDSGYALRGSTDPTAAGIALLDSDIPPTIYTMTHTDSAEPSDVRLGACLTDLSLNNRWNARWEQRAPYSDNPEYPQREDIVFGPDGWIAMTESAEPSHVYLNTCELVH
ncbi:hypothetical protein [Actinomyces vulturis]|uniref:hypothetical protein n=1 Tax=Actinomyces vulturis TaxID=1857645 RepID=UPI00159ED309|nr:hypothetical protein [Actinomyces vulturis]